MRTATQVRALSMLDDDAGIQVNAQHDPGYHDRMSITNPDTIHRNFFLGFIRLHILYHACQEPIFGLGMIRELESHGYSLSPGTLYPILHALEKNGFLKSEQQVVEGKVRKYYTATAAGEDALSGALEKMRELMDEIDTELVAAEAPG